MKRMALGVLVVTAGAALVAGIKLQDLSAHACPLLGMGGCEDRGSGRNCKNRNATLKAE